MEELFHDRVAEFHETLALHFAKGQDLPRAYHYLKMSAQKAIRSYALQEAFDYFNRPYGVYAILCSYYALSLEMTGHFEAGEREYLKGHQVAGETQNLHSLSLLELNHGMAHNIRGEGVKAIEHLTDCIRYCEEGRIKIYLGLAWSGLGWGHCLLGDLSSARKYIEKGVSIHRGAEMPFFLSMHHMLATMVDIESDDLIRAREDIELGIQFSKRFGEKWIEGISLVFLGRIIGKSDRSRADQAVEHIGQGLEILESLSIRPVCAQAYLILAELYLNSGKRIKALRNLMKAKRMFKDQDSLPLGSCSDTLSVV